jgi:hypothetical protein
MYIIPVITIPRRTCPVMHSVKIALAFSLLLVCLCAPALTAAENGGPSASGSFRFSVAGLIQTVDFNVRTDMGGDSSGQLTFSGAAEIPDQDVDGEGGPQSGGTVTDVHYTARFDCLEVSGNRAVMSGFVTGSTIPSYIGQQVLLVVEDNGEGVNAPGRDGLTWGVYRQNARAWTPSDAEWENDPGVGLIWTATDAERTDDVGVPSHRSEQVTCKSFPLSSYSLTDVAHGDGNIQVRP